ncbi:hypothetical protein SAMN05192569_103521 [Parageobacillus thermantarcticus]|uniref:DUF6884 domain-containing protein n=1 Tax=Parageobacillus thermantarcticus TaxID=186116 RepID=A0A1I0TKI6_9BACL|nr:DUF6884 domain-containing protein [Parageobacillus thermantarcticus]SFA52292.1 hypothetical protein SAMN05192569_103521 [Parageobacillus thermantarcticus]
MKIALISCTKKKRSYRCVAKEMYEPSSLFTKAVAFVEKKGYDDWFILSAKYGLLPKDIVIDPYDVTLNQMKASEIKAWSEKVFQQLKAIHPTEIDFFAGKKYRHYLIPMLESQGIRCRVPLQGMKIGEQLEFYNKALNE